MSHGLPEDLEGVCLLEEGGRWYLATRNLVPGNQLMGERLLSLEGVEYRLWSPYRSKLSAAILNGLKSLALRRGTTVLYLGAAAGTTASYISDIVGLEGIVFCIEFAPRPMKELLRTCAARRNMVPVLADARRPEDYAHIVAEADFIYQDVAQPNQAEIFCSNARAYLRDEGSGLLMLKARSVDVAKRPSEIFKIELGRLRSDGIQVAETVCLEPFDKDHMAIGIRAPREPRR